MSAGGLRSRRDTQPQRQSKFAGVRRLGADSLGRLASPHVADAGAHFRLPRRAILGPESSGLAGIEARDSVGQSVAETQMLCCLWFLLGYGGDFSGGRSRERCTSRARVL